MKIEDIAKTQLDQRPYRGYLLQYISESILTEDDLWGRDQLERIPRKISYFLHRDKIDRAYNIAEYDYYVVIANDGTIFNLYY